MINLPTVLKLLLNIYTYKNIYTTFIYCIYKVPDKRPLKEDLLILIRVPLKKFKGLV